MNKCIKCNEETKNPKYCSRSCANSVANARSPKRKRTRKCKGCDSLAATGASYCSSECYRQSLWGHHATQTIQDVLYTKHHKSSAFALIRGRARIAMKDCTSCESCGYDKHVEIAHVKPIADFPLDTLVNDVNDRSNLKALCPNCHWEFDHGIQ